MAFLSALLAVLVGISWVAVGNAAESRVPRPYMEISREVRAALRAEAHAETAAEQAAAVHRMAELYREIMQDPRKVHSDLLRENRNRLWSRMTRVRRDLERDLRRKTSNDSSHPSKAVEQAAADLAEQFQRMNSTQGGPTYILEQAGGAFGGGMVPDHGQELIDLIERTIRPDFWDTAGGRGSMFYYRPLMALVVTATTEVHENVAGLLEGLRRAGP